MAVREIEIVIRGRPGNGVVSAAQVIAYVLETEGASVDLSIASVPEDPTSEALRGVRAMVKAEDSVAAAPPLMSLPAEPGNGRAGMANAAKFAIGAILLLMLFGAELRLHFGLRLDTVVTVAGMWAFWRFCLKSAPSTCKA